jgi:hypothetical protein
MRFAWRLSATLHAQSTLGATGTPVLDGLSGQASMAGLFQLAATRQDR